MNSKVNRLPYHMSHRAPLYFLFFSILCQLIGFGLLTFLKDFFIHPALLLALHSVVAFLLSRWLGLSLPWQLFNLLLAPAVVVYGTLELPSMLITIALFLTLTLYLPTFWTRVPYYPTHLKMYETILEQLPKEGVFRFIDLGCGFGNLIFFLAQSRPQGTFEGVEISPLAFIVTKVRAKFKGLSNLSIHLKNFWGISLDQYDVVYAFLAPGPMPGLWEKVQEEMKPGSVFITNTFAVDEDAGKTITIDDSHQGKIFVHRMT